MAQRPRHLGQSDARLRGSRVLPLLVGFGFLCLGATMTAIGVISIQQDLDQKRAELFEHEADELTLVIEERIEGAAAIMGGLDGLFAAGDVARNQFDDYIARIEHSPGFDAVNAVGFNRLVRRDDVPQFEADV